MNQQGSFDYLGFLLEQIELYKITAYEIGQATGLNIKGVEKILKGITKKPQFSTLEKIENYIIEKSKRGNFLEQKPAMASEPNPQYQALQTMTTEETIITLKELSKLQSEKLEKLENEKREILSESLFFQEELEKLQKKYDALLKKTK